MIHKIFIWSCLLSRTILCSTCWGTLNHCTVSSSGLTWRNANFMQYFIRCLFQYVHMACILADVTNICQRDGVLLEKTALNVIFSGEFKKIRSLRNSSKIGARNKHGITKRVVGRLVHVVCQCLTERLLQISFWHNTSGLEINFP